MKIAEGLLLRKQLEAKVKQLEPLKVQGDNGLFELKTKRVKITDEIDEITLQTSRVSMADVTREYDHYASELRKLDSSIQQANWIYDLDYSESSKPGKEVVKKKGTSK